MGYNLSIGEGFLRKNDEDEWGDGYLSIEVTTIERPDAPAFGEPTDYTNERWPSYTSWWEFAEFADMTDILFDPESNGNIRSGHPGHHLITEKFKKDVDDAMKRYMKKFPNAVPTFDNFEQHRENGELCRLVWLQYWVDWALNNCINPIFKNT